MQSIWIACEFHYKVTNHTSGEPHEYEARNGMYTFLHAFPSDEVDANATLYPVDSCEDYIIHHHQFSIPTYIKKPMSKTVWKK